jgi:AMMECR1 domain-containing protein
MLKIKTGVGTLILLLSVLSTPAGAKMKESASLLGKSVLYIKAALPEIERQKLDLNLYRVTVFEENNSVFVVLADKNASNDSVRGSPGKIPAFQVELDRDSMQILKSSFVR